MKHQLKITVGNFKKSKFTSSLNLIGLTSALAAFILIMLYVWNEYHFDNYHTNAENIYRLEYKNPEGGKTGVFLFGPTGETLVDEFSEIANTTTYMPWGKWGEQPFTYENQSGIQHSYEDYSFGDEKLTAIFTFNFVVGQANPLENPETAIVNETFAHKAWGNEDPVGKIIKAVGGNYTVTGVFKDLPENSIFTCPIILKMPTHGFIAEARTGWDITNYPQFIMAKPGVDTKELNELINRESIVKSKYRFFDNGKTAATIVARPVSELRFANDVNENPLFDTNNKIFVDSLFVVGILILLVALVNYINFATANLPVRMKTFNINRVIGGSKWASAIQLIFETFVLFAISFGVAILLANGLNKLFSVQMLGYKLPFSQNYILLTIIGLVALLSAFIAGIYPAIVSTTGQPLQTLKRSSSGMNEKFRGSLTIFQFAATIALIVASIAVMKQVNYMQDTDLGFDKSSTMVVPMFRGVRNNLDAFKNKLNASPYVKQVACSRAVPGISQETNTFIVNGQACPVWNWAVDDEYMDMMGFEIIEGRGFLKDSEAENGNFICNETAAKRYNWTVGTKINDNQLVGIMKDFNLVSLREQIEPFVYHKARSLDELQVVCIKLQGNTSHEALADVKSAFEEICPDVPFRSFFLDDQLNLLYAKENQQSKLISFFSILSVIVSMLGILGLSIFMCQQKIKEIGIRKVNGATIYEVMLMLNKSFVKWVVIAFVLAVPVAWYSMTIWLGGFAFKTTLSWWIFALAGMFALGIALLTVSWQSWRAATRNPVEALRYE